MSTFYVSRSTCFGCVSRSTCFLDPPVLLVGPHFVLLDPYVVLIGPPVVLLDTLVCCFVHSFRVGQHVALVATFHFSKSICCGCGSTCCVGMSTYHVGRSIFCVGRSILRVSMSAC